MIWVIGFFDEIIWVKGWGNNGALKGKPLFGSYPYPPTPKILDSIFENILVFKKHGRRNVPKEIKDSSRLSKEEWIEFTMGIWVIEPDRKAKHPAVFPIEIPLRLIKMYSFVNDTVYDPFAGTGTTLIAAHMTERQAIGVEINPKFKLEFMKKMSGIPISDSLVLRSLWSSCVFVRENKKVGLPPLKYSSKLVPAPSPLEAGKSPASMHPRHVTGKI